VAWTDYPWTGRSGRDGDEARKPGTVKLRILGIRHLTSGPAETNRSCLVELSLRARFGLAVAAVTIVLVAVFATAMAFFIEVLEHELLHDTLSRELAEHRDLLIRDPDWPDLTGDELTRMVVDQGDLKKLPRPLRDLGTRLEGEIELEGRTYLVRATDIGHRRLILMLDIAPVEELERRLALAALLTALAGVSLAGLLVLVLGRRLSR
jgi:hypothetical protein